METPIHTSLNDLLVPMTRYGIDGLTGSINVFLAAYFLFLAARKQALDNVANKYISPSLAQGNST
jgi:hypothetical protein